MRASPPFALHFPHFGPTLCSCSPGIRNSSAESGTPRERGREMAALPDAPPGPPPAAFAASTSNLASSASSTPSPSGTRTGPPRIVNLYRVRTVATPKQCYVCHRETTTCLATDGVTDFLYTCKHHLLDPGFARPAPASGTATPTSAPASPTLSPPVPRSEIDKVKKEYEEKQKRKEATAASGSSADSKDKEGKDESSSSSRGPASTAISLFKTGASALSSLSSQASSTLFPPPAAPAEPSAAERARTAAAQAKVFVLHKDFFRMRLDKKRKEWEKKDAEERGRQWSFPKAPRGGLSGP
ncbi:DUF1742-domain-containing protein [Rhodotorula sp. JG-1b]|nr:DUF1742-domain-containing protein [Rhodotorula sp. JG-1b]